MKIELIDYPHHIYMVASRIEYKIRTNKNFQIYIQYEDMPEDDLYDCRFEFEISDIKTNDVITAEELFDKFHDYIKFDNKQKNIIAYHPELIIEWLGDVVSALNRRITKTEIKNSDFDSFNFNSFYERDNTLFASFRNKSNQDLTIDFDLMKVKYNYSQDDNVIIDHESFIKEKMNYIDINSIEKLYGIKK